MRKWLCPALITVAFSLSACGGNVSEVNIVDIESEIYSSEDIDSAISVIIKDFARDWDGCTLKEIYYAGDEISSNNQDYADRSNADEIIVLFSSFDVDSSGADVSLNPDSTYNRWQWLLIRNNGSQWKQVDHGY